MPKLPKPSEANRERKPAKKRVIVRKRKTKVKNSEPKVKGFVFPANDEEKDGDIVISYSEIDTYRQCPLKWHLAYKERWTKPEREDMHPLTKGTLWHAVMETHYTYLKLIQDGELSEREGLQQMSNLISGMLINQTTGEQSELQQLVAWMYKGYIESYGYDEQWEILAVEKKFQYRLTDSKGNPSPYLLKGKLDLIVKDKNTGKVWLIDHKSGSNLPNDQELNLADQFTVYAWLLRQAGVDVLGVIHSAARTQMNAGDKPENQDENGNPLKSSQKKQTLEQRFRRTILNRSETEQQLVVLDFWATAANAYPEASGFAPLPRYSAPDTKMCSWKCDFLDAHMMARSGRSLQEVLTEQGFEQNFERH